MGGTRISGRARSFRTPVRSTGSCRTARSPRCRVDGHALWVNEAALRAAGIGSVTRDPEGGRILRRPDGSPSGVLIDNAMELVSRVVPVPSAADGNGGSSPGPPGLRARGTDRGAGRVRLRRRESIAALERLAARGALPIRVYATVSPDPKALPGFLAAKGARVGGPGGFPDRPRHQGLCRRRAREPGRGAAGGLRGRAGQARTAGHPAGAAGGDRARRPQGRLAALDPRDRRPGQPGRARRFRSGGGGDSGVPRRGPGARASSTRSSSRPRTSPDSPRLGVIASVQPTHATSDMVWAEDRLGPSRIAGAYAWQRLRRRRAPGSPAAATPPWNRRTSPGVLRGSDSPGPHGKPPGGWRPGEALSRRRPWRFSRRTRRSRRSRRRWRGRIEAGLRRRFHDPRARSSDGPGSGDPSDSGCHDGRRRPHRPRTRRAMSRDRSAGRPGAILVLPRARGRRLRLAAGRAAEGAVRAERPGRRAAAPAWWIRRSSPGACGTPAS